MKIDTALIGIRIQLVWWGRLSRALGIGYPSMSTTEKARVGRGGTSDGPSLPIELLELDHAVAIAPVEHKIILIEHYTKSGHWTEKAMRLGICRGSYFEKKKSAEVHLKSELNSENRQPMLRAG